MMRSVLNVLDVDTGGRTVLSRFDYNAETPIWSPDGSYLLFNACGKLYRYVLADGDLQEVRIDGDLRCNNDHCIAPDGSWYGISASSQVLGGGSRVWKLPASGGRPELVTALAPSYLHGISPDGRTFAYCAERNGDYDVYTIPVSGGEEHRLTTAPGLDDGPEYAPDGRTIWFNSVRSGSMQVFRMDPDGGEQRQMTSDDCQNWFPHVSPDGSRVVFLSYLPGETEPSKHPANRRILLRLMNADGSDLRTVFTPSPFRTRRSGHDQCQFLVPGQPKDRVFHIRRRLRTK